MDKRISSSGMSMASQEDMKSIKKKKNNKTVSMEIKFHIEKIIITKTK